MFISLLITPWFVWSWGFFGHKSINRAAVYTLPTELAAFYKENIEFITSHAVDADMRRYAIKEEAPRHYIDLDYYGADAIHKMPRKWQDAVDKYSEDTIQANGIVPWHIEKMYYRLVNAFKRRDVPYILKTSADLGHYIGDAHVPLHTTSNYNGQKTNQHGIHGFWESRLPELYAEDYDFLVGKAHYIQTPLDFIWEKISESNNAVDTVLNFEKILSDQYPSDGKYAFVEKGNQTVKTYSLGYSKAYHDMMDGMVERRMRSAIITIGCFWYSAWVDAGKPDLSVKLTEDQKNQLAEEQEALKMKYEDSKIFGRDHAD